eukprot:TCONS_00068077-protein
MVFLCCCCSQTHQCSMDSTKSSAEDIFPYSKPHAKQNFFCTSIQFFNNLGCKMGKEAHAPTYKNQWIVESFTPSWNYYFTPTENQTIFVSTLKPMRQKRF